MDIVVTIPRYEYENDREETKLYLKDPSAYEQFWTLSKTPKHLQKGDRIYLVRNQTIESSMRIVRIQKNSSTRCEVTGRTWKGSCQLFMDDLREEQIDIQVRGFQGFRYRWWS